jgi:membrane fusion protein (multidrug efflux system)
MPDAATDKTDVDRSAPNQTEARSVGGGTAVERAPKSAAPTVSRHRFTHRRKLLIGVIGVLGLAVICLLGIPWIGQALNTVSTDDAYVNGHVTFVAPRVGGQIARVLVDDNNRVHKGQILAQLDKEPYQIAISQKQAAVDTAKADLQAAKAAARSIEANASSRRWALQHAVENVDNQIALLHARVAELDKSKAALALAQVEFDRTKQLVTSGTASRQEFDQRQAALITANAGVTQSLAEIHQVRVSLGLSAQPGKGEDLDSVPPDLDDTFSAVLQAQSELIQSAAQLGVVHSFDGASERDGHAVRKAGRHRRHVRQACGAGSRRQTGRGQARSRAARTRSG